MLCTNGQRKGKGINTLLVNKVMEKNQKKEITKS
jgi:hypothetical protein